MNRTLRIAYIIGSMREGGAEGQLIELMRGMRARGHEVRLYLLHYRGVRLRTALDEGFGVVDVGLPKLRPLLNPSSKLGALRALLRTARSLKSFRPDILHPWMFEADCWAVLAKALGAPGRLITTRRIIGKFMDRARWKTFVQRRINRHTRAVVVNSRAVREDAMLRERNLRKGRIRLIYNVLPWERLESAAALDLRAALPFLAGATHVAVNVANLLPYKGHLDLVDAWRDVVREFPDAHILCVGSDEGMGSAIRRRISEAGLQDRMHLLGSRTDVPSVLKGADLFVLQSHEEGFSNALLEAMACGLPVVATNIAGNPEAVGHCESGLLVPAHDPESLAAAILELLRDSEKRRRFGAAGRASVQRRFGAKRFLDAYERLYLEVAR